MAGAHQGSPRIKDGWFAEDEVMWPGQKMSLKVEEVLYQGRSDYQDVLVFQSSTYGRVLVLDGVIQVTEKDEMAYQEMIAHIPLFAHPNPQSVLIVGGGDGGVLREVARHRCVRNITMCEIDKEVVEVSKRFLSHVTATSFDDERLELLFEDASKFVERRPAWFDVVIVDSSDPVGPAESLYTTDFYAALRRSLKPGGIICNQGECQWLHLDLISKVLGDCGKSFSTVEYAFTTIPTYPCGQIGFLLCSLSSEPNMLRTPRRRVPAEMQAALRYYTADVHRAAFVLPHFAERVVGPLRKNRRSFLPRDRLALAAVALASAACTFLLSRRR